MRHLARNSVLPIVASFAASLALLACGGEREAQGVTPEENSVVAEARKPAPPVPPPAPATGVVPAARDPWATGDEQEAANPEAAAGSGQPGVNFGSEASESEEVRPRKQQEPLPSAGSRVFTNKDLQRYKSTRIAFGMEDDPPAVASGAAPEGDSEDRKKAAGDKPLTPEEVQQQITATEAEIAIAEKDLEYLKSRNPSLRNPYLARVTPSDGDATAESGMDNVQRLAHVQERIGETEQKLSELRQKLETLKQTPPPSDQ